MGTIFLGYMFNIIEFIRISTQLSMVNANEEISTSVLNVCTGWRRAHTNRVRKEKQGFIPGLLLLGKMLTYAAL